MLEWLHGFTAAEASFLGSLTGSGIGLVALLSGALFNAHLNRRRDDRLRSEEARGVRRALIAELEGVNESLKRNAEGLEHSTGDFVLPDVAHSVRVMPYLLPKVGLLKEETIRTVV